MKFMSDPSAVVVLAALLLLAASCIFPQEARAIQVQQPTLTVTVNTTVSPTYNLLGSAVEQVSAVIVGTGLTSTSPTTVTLQVSFQPLHLLATANLSGTSVNMPVVRALVAGVYQYEALVPARASSISVLVDGTQSGSSLLWRFVTDVPLVTISGLPAAPHYTNLVTLPDGSHISSVFDSYGTALPGQSASPTGGQGPGVTYTLDGSVSLLVIESNLYQPAAAAVAVASVVFLVLYALNLFPSGRPLVASLVDPAKGFLRRLAWVGKLNSKAPFQPRSLFQPKRILVLFLLCSVLMIGAAASAGPDPRVKAYVIADQATVPQIASNLGSIAGPVQAVTPAEDYTDFNVMSSVGEFNLVVVSDYPSVGVPAVSRFVLAGFSNVPLIIVDRTADPVFADQIRTLYPDKVVSVGNAASLNSTELQLIAQKLPSTLRQNHFGFAISTGGFTALLASEGVLSFVLVFLGAAFLGSLISDSDPRNDIKTVAYFISSGVFVFVFTEAVFVTTSSLLAMPLSLHAVLSGSREITAVGTLGFGGGSVPRLAAGVVGLLIGVIGTPGGPRVSKSDLALILGLSVFLLANPFAIGEFVYQGILLFAGGYTFGSAYASALSLKGFIYGVGHALGGGVTPTYLMSAGKMLYFAGLVPAAFTRRMSRTTTVLLLLVAALFIGDGGVRVGEMTPDKTMIAIVPGLVAGFAFTVLFLGLAAIEKFIRSGSRKT